MTISAACSHLGSFGHLFSGGAEHDDATPDKRERQTPPRVTPLLDRIQRVETYPGSGSRRGRAKIHDAMIVTSFKVECRGTGHEA